MSFWVFLPRLALALFLGCLIGFERQWHQKMAGTRTNGLVAAGAAAFIMASGFIAIGPNGLSRFADESGVPRVLGQIISGIGFLGAGVIFKEGANVRGLNTAATVWCSAAVGALAGLGHVAESVTLTVFVLFTNLTLRPLVYKVHPMGAEFYYRIDLKCDATSQEQLRSLVLRYARGIHASIQSMRVETAGDQARVSILAVTYGKNDSCIEKMIRQLSESVRISELDWQAIGRQPERKAA